MKPTRILSILLLTCILACLTTWTAEEWKSNLCINPHVYQCAANFIVPLPGVSSLPEGTSFSYEIIFTPMNDMPQKMTLSLTICGKDTLDNVPCTRVGLVEEMIYESVTLNFSGTEWVDQEGKPLKLEGKAQGEFNNVSIPTSYTAELVREEVYSGHECWVFSTTEKTTMGTAETEVNALRYMDSQNNAIVRMVIMLWDREIDTGYIEPFIETADLTWELGGKERIFVPLGEYDCQVIYLKENDQIRGTIYANKRVKVPLKYVFSQGEFTMTMTLIEYKTT